MVQPILALNFTAALTTVGATGPWSQRFPTQVFQLFVVALQSFPGKQKDGCKPKKEGPKRGHKPLDFHFMLVHKQDHVLLNQ